MKTRNLLIIAALTLAAAVAILTACSKFDPEPPVGQSSYLQGSIPQINVENATNIEFTSANVVVTVTTTGGRKITRLALFISTNQTPSISDQVIELGSVNSGDSNISQTVNLNNLSHNTTYYYRAYALNSEGATYSNIRSFITLLNERLPQVNTLWTNNITETTANLNGEIINTGQSTSVTQHGFVWATHNNPTLNDNKTQLGGSGTASFTSKLTGLIKGKRYYYRAYATNNYGTSYGIVRDFQTTFWIRKADFGGGNERSGAIAFTIGDKVYYGTGLKIVSGYGQGDTKDIWEYNSLTNTWTQKADFAGAARRDATAFAIGNKGYVGLGLVNGYIKAQDFWEYDPSNNSWTEKAWYPLYIGGTYDHHEEYNFGFAIGGKGYIGNLIQNRIFEYNPSSNTWTEKSSFTFGGYGWRVSAFAIGNKGYANINTRFWEYDPAVDTWTQKADFPLNQGLGKIEFTIGTKGYVYASTLNTTTNREVWAYNQNNNTWERKADYAKKGYSKAFSVGGKGYIVDGIELWEYDPSIDNK